MPLAAQFIVFDGPEGCGKSTQTQLLVAELQHRGQAVVSVRDPGATRIGEQIRAILLDPNHTEMGMRCEMLLYMAARAQLMAETILPALQLGQTVICDRFISSTLAYQLGGDGLGAEEIRAVGDIAVRKRWPDRTIILDMPPRESFGRMKREKDRIEQRPMEYHETVRANYLEQAAKYANYTVIDAARDREIVHRDVLAYLGLGGAGQ